MNSLLETFQKVVESGREDPTEGITLSSAGGITSSNGNGGDAMPSDVGKLKKLVLAKQRAYDVLYEESAELQVKLAKTTRRLSLQRDLWLTTLEHQENTIQSLVEAAVRASTSTNGEKGQQPSPVEDGGVYVNSLLEQIEMLKRSLTEMSTKKEALQVALSQELEQRARAGRSHAMPMTLSESHAEADEEHQGVLRKLIAQWDMEKAEYESQIEELTGLMKQSTESMELLAHKHNAELEKLSGFKRTFMDNMANSVRNDQPAPAPGEPPSGEGKSKAAELPSRQVSPTPFSSPSPPSVAGEALPSREDSHSAATLTELQAHMVELQTELEQSRHECRAREDALSAMFEDNKRLEEINSRLREELALYRAESSHASADTGSLQRQLAEEVQKTRSVTVSLEASQRAQEQLQREVASLQEKLRALPSGSPASPAVKAGSVISSGGPGGKEERGLRAASHLRAREFVQSATAKLSRAKEKSSTIWMHSHLQIILGLVLGLTILMFVSLAFGGNGPVTQHDDMTTEMALRAQLASCRMFLREARGK